MTILQSVHVESKRPQSCKETLKQNSIIYYSPDIYKFTTKNVLSTAWSYKAYALSNSFKK